jgi:4-amino-4-deoxy-L-arabinose transferase-like glycosyltransferase
MEGLGFVNEQGAPTAYTPPGYPAFLALALDLFGDSKEKVALLQALMGAATSLFTYMIARRLFGLGIAMLAGTLMALSPTSIVYSGELLSEVPSTAIILGAWMLLVQDKSAPERANSRRLTAAGGAGLMMGLAILIRPAALSLALGLFLHLLCTQRATRPARAKTAVAFGLGITIALAPWTYRNFKVFDSFVPVATNGGFNLLLGNNPEAFNGGWMELREADDLLKQHYEAQGDAKARKSAINWITRHPVSYAKICLRRALVWMSVAPDYIPGIRLSSTREVDALVVQSYKQHGPSSTDPNQAPALRESRSLNWRILTIWSLLLIPAAALGLLLDMSRRPQWVLLLPFATYVTILSMTFMQHRFREIMTPMLAIYASVGLSGLRQLLSHRAPTNSKGRLVLLAALPIGLLFGLQVLRDFDAIRTAL